MTNKNILLSLCIFIFAFILALSCTTSSDPNPIAPEIITLFAAEELVETGDRTLVVCVASDEDTSSENLAYSLNISNGISYEGPNRYSAIVEKIEGANPVVTCIVTDETGLSADQSLSL